MNRVLVLAAAVLMVGGGLAQAGDQTKSEKKALKEAKKAEKARQATLKVNQKVALTRAWSLFDSRFSIPNESADLAWQRATEWVTLCSGFRLDVATDSVLQTYRSSDVSNSNLTCEVNRSRGAKETVFTTSCFSNNMFGGSTRRRGSAMLKRYIMTGDMLCLNDGKNTSEAVACLIECNEANQKCAPRPPEILVPQEDYVQTGSCSIEQITAMVKAGLTEKQIKAACEGDD